MRDFRALACVLALGAAMGITGCDDDDHPKPDGGTNPLDGGTPDAGPPEFTAFVKDLIENQTNETGSPVTLDDKTFVDSEPTDAFPPDFFQ
jgi:hypothetical protein